MIDDSKSMYSKEERADIYKYVAARFLVGHWARQDNFLGMGYAKRVSAYLYNHKAETIDIQCVGEVKDDFPEFEAQRPEGWYSIGTMCQWHDSLFRETEEEYLKYCLEWLEGALKLCQNG